MGIYEINAELMAKKNQVISLNGEIARKNVEIACNLEQIKRKDEEIARKNEEIFGKDKEIALRNEVIANKSEEILKLKEKLRQYRELKEAFKQIDPEDLETSLENSPEKTVVAAEPDKMVEEATEKLEKGANLEVDNEGSSGNLEADDEESSGFGSSPVEQQQIDAGSDNSHAPNQLPGLSILQLQRWCSSSTSSVSPINPKNSSDNTLRGADEEKSLVPVTPGSISSDLNSSNSDPDPRLIFHSEDGVISGHGIMVSASGEFLIDPQMSMGQPVPLRPDFPMGKPMRPVLMGHPAFPGGVAMGPQLMESPMGKHPMGPMPMHMQMRPTMMYHPSQMGQQIYVQPGQPLKLTNRPPLGPFIRPVPVYPQMDLQPIYPQTGQQVGQPMTTSKPQTMRSN